MLSTSGTLLRLRSTTLACAFLLLAAVGCAGPDPDQTAAPADPAYSVNTSPEQNRVRAERIEAVAARVPIAVRQRGTLVVATTSTSPPLTFRATDDRTVIGSEPDIAQLVADVLGLRLELQPTSFENMFLGVESGRYDAAFSNLTVTEERKDKYDLATYRTDTLSFEESVTAPPGPPIADPAGISGRTVGVIPGTNQEQLLLAWNKLNEQAGREPATISYYPNVGDYYLALESGRLDLYFGPNPSVAYHVATTGRSRVAGTVNGGGGAQRADIGALTRKGNGLAEPFRDAVNSVIADGRYGQVLDRWRLGAEAVMSSQVNPPGLARRPSS